MRQVDQASAAANAVAAAGRIPGRLRRRATLALFAALAGCAAPAGAPSLYDVPERPRLSPAAERSATAEALRGDAVTLWEEAQALRTRTGKTALPPPAWLREPIRPPATPPAAAARPRNPEAAIVAERVRGESDDGSLDSFLRQLVRRQPGAAVVEVAADEAALDGPTVAEAAPGTAKATRPSAADESALDRFLEQLGGRLAVGRPERPPVPAGGEPATSAAAAAGPDRAPPAASSPATAPATAVPPATRPAPAAARPAPSARPIPPKPAAPAAVPTREPPAAAIEPPAADGTLSGRARHELEQVVERAREQGAAVEVVGHGATPALALERARRVARLVVELGPPAGGLTLRAAGPGERVELYILSRPPS